MIPTYFLHTKILDIKYLIIWCYILIIIVNQELENINQWFISNKLSLNIKYYSFFNKSSQKEDIPLLLPKLIINNYEIKQIESSFLGFY